MAKTKAFLLLCVLLMEEASFNHNQKCSRTSGIVNNVTWPETEDIALSEPPCVDENWEFLYRKCSDGKWDDEPFCFYIQTKPPNCPDDFEYSEELQICHKIINQTFPPKCPFENSLPYAFYHELMDKNGPFWLPVTRNGLDFFRWIEASSLYQTYFDWSVEGGGRDKNCVLYHSNSRIEAVSCHEHHLFICAYKPLNQLDSQLCPNCCAQIDFAANSSCFCFSEDPSESSPKAEFLKPYQNSIYQKLTNRTCSIGLQRNPEGDYMWAESTTTMNYTYWSRITVFDDDHIYGAANRDGWILTERLYDCAILKQEKQVLEPSLWLRLEADNQLMLTVYDADGMRSFNANDSKPVVYCFTTADPLSLIARYSTITWFPGSDGGTYYFEGLSEGPGDYWCEGFKYLNMERVNSDTVFAIPPGSLFEFVAILKLEYGQEIDPLSQDIINLINATLFDRFKKAQASDKVYTPRIMKIVDLDEDNRQIWLNIHFSQKITTSSTNHNAEYFYVEKLLKAAVKQLKEPKIEIVKFRSTSFCMTNKTKLTWPQTLSNTTTFPVEMCLKKDGFRVSRFCQDDFYDGAHWIETDEQCTVFKTSRYTESIFNLFINSQIGDAIANFRTDEIRLYQPIDLFYVSKIFEKFVDDGINLDIIYLENFLDATDRLLEIERSIFLEAQYQLNASDRILKAINKALLTSPNEISLWHKNNFLVRSGIYTTSPGIIVTELDGHRSSIEINDQDTITDIVKTKNMVSAVWIDEELQDQAFDTKTIMIIYFKNLLFTNIHEVTESLEHIFEVLIPSVEPLLVGTVRIFQKNESRKTHCSFWDYTNKPGLWKISGTSTELTTSVQTCKFGSLKHLAFTFDDINVTETLIDIFDSNTSVPEIMTGLCTVSKSYTKFDPFDVFITGKILEKVNEDPEIDLTALAEIINNLHLVQKETLEESQAKNKSTDAILRHVDKIVQNHNYQSRVEIVSENFMIFISDIKKSNFSGLILLEDNQTMQAQILENEVEIEEIVKYENLASAVVIDSELRNQLEKDTKIVVTVFANDALFNEVQTRSKQVTKIFGVILPELEEYKGAISVLHKVAQNNYEEDCTHWHYNQTVEGSWIKDQAGQNLSSFIHCQFWHTTHFALLLLDQDKYQENQILDWITAINSALSLFGLSCILLTGIFFKRWRNNAGNQILLNFVVVMVLQISLFYVSGIIDQEDYWLCTGVGVVLHFFTISEFCWMLVIAFLQFKRFVQVLGGPPQHILLKSFLAGWVLPLFFVVGVFVSDQDNYVSSKVGICYPSGFGLYFGVWLPIVFIIAINFIFFIYIIFSVIRSKSECGNIGSNEAIFQWRLGILLFFMLGLTWIFGFLAELDFGDIFVYLFSLTATLQGFVLFLFFVVFNISTKYLYVQVFKNCCKIQMSYLVNNYVTKKCYTRND